ncbi:bifunctional histidinol-phosphatase/imidazoleglycerol-phosphate dehydratase HisB [Candidatus Ishikawella capsulata]|nr:bifunctional histidinol-phosphatase/imidazoleglycerol-phosphate dehydratase HisB [Candidatus Ishikawaella capsulata]
MNQKTLFVDRDGTIVTEPQQNFQIDHVDKINFEPKVIPALLALQNVGYRLVMVTNQDGLGTSKFPNDNFYKPHNFIMKILNSQGIYFDDVLICPHTSDNNCECRKPKTKMLEPWLQKGLIDLDHSYVIGDRISDIELAKNMGIKSIKYGNNGENWESIKKTLTKIDRYSIINRTTKETNIQVEVWLDREGNSNFNTGIGFFDHMLNQIAVHGGFRMNIKAIGDLYIDDHHTVEDTGLALGSALIEALGNKRGIKRFGFVLPMDECLAFCSLDICGRPFFHFKSDFKYQKIGDLSTEMVEHFFRSLSCNMLSTLHLKTKGKNDHHRVESLFKVFGRTLRQAIHIENSSTVPSSKGIL